MRRTKTLDLKIKIHPFCPNDNPISDPARPGDIGLDLKCWVDNKKGEVSILPWNWMNIRTGVFIELPEGCWADVRSRSSTFCKRHLFVLQGVIDPLFRGELSVIVWNATGQHHLVKTGDRLAQLIIMPVMTPKIKIVKRLSKTDRNELGFGSTG